MRRPEVAGRKLVNGIAENFINAGLCRFSFQALAVNGSWRSAS